jgi:hypothetical protein
MKISLMVGFMIAGLTGLSACGATHSVGQSSATNGATSQAPAGDVTCVPAGVLSGSSGQPKNLIANLKSARVSIANGMLAVTFRTAGPIGKGITDGSVLVYAIHIFVGSNEVPTYVLNFDLIDVGTNGKVQHGVGVAAHRNSRYSLTQIRVESELRLRG